MRAPKFRRTRDNSFLLRQNSETSQSLFIRGDNVLCTTRVLQPSVFRTDTLTNKPLNELPQTISDVDETYWVIETGGDGMRLHDLTVLGLKQVGLDTMQDTGSTQ
jgi:hypothetical protein